MKILNSIGETVQIYPRCQPSIPASPTVRRGFRAPFVFRAVHALVAAALSLSSASAATLELTTIPPTPDADDVYNLIGGANDDANLNNGSDGNNYVAGDRPTQGQTFTTGANAGGYVLSDIWIRHAGYTEAATSGNGTWWNMGNGGVWVLRVTDPSKSGQAGFVVRSETYVSTGTENNGAVWTGGNGSLGDDVWLHFTLGTPVQVAPGTVYGIDLTATGSPGLNYFEWLGNETNVLTSGTAYTGTTAATPGNSVNNVAGDRVFLVQLGNFVPAVQPELTSPLRFVPAGQTVQVAAVIPSIANANTAATLVITNNSPGIISLPGGVNSITLNFAAGATNVQTFNVQVLAKGSGSIGVIPNSSFTTNSLEIGTPIVAEEPFHYDAVTQMFLEGANGGTGFSGPWVQPSFADIIVAGLEYQNGATAFVTSSNAAGVSGAGNEAFRSLEGTYGGVGGGTVYIGFLVQAPGGAISDWGGLSLFNGPAAENLFMGSVLSLSPNDTWGFLQGGNVQMNFAGSPTPGLQVDLLVYRIDFPATNGGMARVSFHANPPMNSTEPFSPTGSALVNNFTFDRIRLGTSDTLYFDEIRLGTAWTNIMRFTGPAQPLPPPAPQLTIPTRFIPIGGSGIVTVTIPASAPQPVSMVISNDNPAAFSISSSNAALTTLTFANGATNVQTFTIQTLAEGIANLTVLSNATINTASLTVAAQVSASESFAYEAGVENLPGQAGGSGFDVNAWTGVGSVTSPGLTYPGLLASSNSATIITGNADRLLSSISGVHGGAGGGTVWVSFLAQGAFPETPGSAGVSLLSAGGVPLFLGLSTAAPNNGRWGFTGAAQGQDADFPDSVAPSTNTTLLVYRIDFPVSGELAQITFYANPPVGPNPPASPSGSGAVRNFTFDGIRIGTDFNMIFDELRLGASWAAVVPGTTVPELAIERIGNTQVRVTWADVAGATLQSSSSLNGPWAAANLIESTQAGQRIATDTLAGTAKFYRLVR